MFCSECGKEVGDGDLFCPECGTKLEVDDVPAEEETEGATELLNSVTPAVQPAVQSVSETDSEGKTQLLSGINLKNEPEPVNVAPAQTFTKASETPKAANTKALKISLIVGCVVAVVLLVLVILAASKPSIGFLKDTPFSSATSVEQTNEDDATTDDNENSDESDKSETDKKSEDKSSTDTSKTKTYVLENSSSKELTNSDISGLTDDEICIAQNEIWARHGRKFKNNWLQAYFNKQSWYSGTIEADEFLNKYSPSDLENKNAQFLNSVLSSRGYDLNKVHPN